MVDRELKTPLYIQVFEALLRQITDGTYSRGQMLPAEKDLADMYSVDRQTVRRSLELLANDGVVEKRAGVGSFVQDFATRSQAPKNGIGTFAFILPGPLQGVERITEPFNAKLFSAIEQECRKRGYYLTYTTVKQVEDLRFLPEKVAGIFIVSHVEDTIIDEIIVRGYPAVVINNFHPACISILEDSLGGAQEGVSYLIHAGHRNIGYIGGIPGYITSEDRFTGFIRACIDAGLDWHAMAQESGDWTFDGGFRCMQSILGRPSEIPTAVFAANDMMAFGAVEAIQSLDLTVPDDISIIGFDDIDQCRYATPHLSTVGVDVELTATVAVTNLFHLLGGDIDSAYKIIIPTKLIIRDTVKRVE